MSGAGHVQRSFGAATVTALLAGAAVSVALGVYGRAHTPTGRDITSFGFGSLIQMKVWLALAAGALALVQLGTALWMYGKLGSRIPRRIGLIHRSIGGLALLVSLPVAFHCLWSLGFQSYSTRVLVHSLLGCLVYGVFVTKVLGLNSKRTPAWLVPVAGGLLFTVLVATVLTSAVWFVGTNGWPTSGGY
ncbi:MAG: DUF6529 family protein [Nocardioidaceae bacterium]